MGNSEVLGRRSGVSVVPGHVDTPRSRRRVYGPRRMELLGDSKGRARRRRDSEDRER
jgi:hypothetical protein